MKKNAEIFGIYKGDIMKSTVKIVCLLTAILLLLSSCQAVYDAPLTPPETTANPEIDLNEEYYTTGMPYLAHRVACILSSLIS